MTSNINVVKKILFRGKNFSFLVDRANHDLTRLSSQTPCSHLPNFWLILLMLETLILLQFFLCFTVIHIIMPRDIIILAIAGAFTAAVIRKCVGEEWIILDRDVLYFLEDCPLDIKPDPTILLLLPNNGLSRDIRVIEVFDCVIVMGLLSLSFLFRFFFFSKILSPGGKCILALVSRVEGRSSSAMMILVVLPGLLFRGARPK